MGASRDYIRWLREKVGHERIILTFVGGCIRNQEGEVLLQGAVEAGFGDSPEVRLSRGKRCRKQLSERYGKKRVSMFKWTS